MPTRPFRRLPLPRSVRGKILIVACAVAMMAGTLGTLPAAASDRVVVVRPGQTLSQIALANGTTVQRLVALNHLSDPNRIYAGQHIRVRPARSAPRHARHPQPVTHLVVYGETLTGIAARYGTSIEGLALRNRLADPSRIYAGQVLRISGSHHQARRPHPSPSGAHGPSHRPTASIHIVRAGETVSGLAVRYRVTVDAIARANRLADVSFIRTGQQLRIPGAQRPGHVPHDVSSAPSHAGPAMPPSMAAVVGQRSAMRALIAREARRQGFPQALALAVAWQESGWQPSVVSSAGAVGVMQLLPATADWVGATILQERINVWEPRSNVRGGIALLRHYLARYGSRPMALAAYYQGQAGTDRYGIYDVSRPYIASILLLERLFGG